MADVSRAAAVGLALAWLWSGAVAEPVTLVAGGRAKAAVIVSAGSTPTSAPAMAAKILCDHLAQMTGAKLPILREEDAGPAQIEGGRLRFEGGRVPPEAESFILVGESDLTRRLGADSTGLGSGGIALKTTGNTLLVLGSPVGPDTRGCRYAAVALLEELGYRYLWPGETGKVIPQRADVVVGPLDKRFSPPIALRHIRWQPGVPRGFQEGMASLGYTPEDWRSRRAEALKTVSPISWTDWHGNNIEAVGPMGGHNGAGLGPHAKEALKEHPEWGALQADGTRDQSKAGERFRLCVSNPELAAYVAELILKKVKESPNTASYSLSPQDGGYSSFCMCENCKKLDPPEAPKVRILLFTKVGQSARREIEYPALTDRYVHYWNAVAARVAAAHPKLGLVVDAYSAYATPPVREKLHPSLVVRYVPSDVAGWEGWKAAGATRIFWRPNNLHSGYREATINYAADARRIADTMNRLAEGGIIGTDMQGIYDNWATQGLNYYVAARTTWNPALKYEDILEDYCRSGFGAGAESVRQYFLKAEALGRTFEKATPEAMTGLKAELDAAAKAAAGDPAAGARIAFLRTGLDYSAATAQAARLRLAAQQGEAFDRARAAAVLDRRHRMMREMFRTSFLAVNVSVVAGQDGVAWRELGWRGPGRTARDDAPAGTGDDDRWLYEDQSQTRGR